MDSTQTPRVLSGRYELSHLVARGGMAEVYRAHDRMLDRPVALKVLFPELSVDRSFVERFRREAQAAANLSHQNIVPVFDWGEDGGTYFIVMEFVDGRALSSILRTAGPLHPDRAVEIAADVAAALSYAHRHGVVHRDVKPGNVLITDEGTVKVTDFGIARAVNTEESLTQTGAVMGTATYFSPEQAEGISVDSRSDIYSLGVVLFEMVTGRPPFVGESPVAVASKHVRENPPSPREINPGVPPDLEAIILKCMAKAPEYRYATGDDLRVDLMRFREGRAVSAGPLPAAAMGTTQTIAAYGSTQALPQVTPAGPELEEAPSRTGLYVGILVVLLVALAVVVFFLGKSLGWWATTTATSNQVTIPNLVGQTVTQAEQTLTNDGLKSKVQADPASSAPNTQVIRTSPGSGTKVNHGSTVTLFTGSAGSPVTVPDLTNQSVQAATSQLQQLGLQVQVAQSANCIQINVVCDQNPKGGQTIVPGGTVTLITAQQSTTTTTSPTTTTTSATVSVPNVVGQQLTTACSLLGQSGLTCGTTTYQSSSLAQGQVISTTPAPFTQVNRGSSVNLVVSSGPGTTAVPGIIGDTPNGAHSALQAAGFTPNPDASCVSGTHVISQNPAANSQQPSGTSVNYSCA
ncbi:MAG TPA: Stk1 family PASTA domain-containing Ser/Thr kinase [Acidimicrobiales bacterium]|nr:Stk1 family PASTA domain-containing Ser/Thr kinase [Acidimicrobiales bacterium]